MVELGRVVIHAYGNVAELRTGRNEKLRRDEKGNEESEREAGEGGLNDGKETYRYEPPSSIDHLPYPPYPPSTI